MPDKNLVGRCGLYCGYCEIYRAYQDSPEFRKELARKNNCRPEEVRCEGCQALSVYGWSGEKEWGANCKILKCLNAKGYKYCIDCSEYPHCAQFEQFARTCSGLGINLRENLQMITEGQEERWLGEQEKRWRCPKCDRPIIVSYDLKNCHWCGEILRD